MQPRGIRNNNPGNIDFAGQAGAHKEAGPHGRFAVFATPEAGLMALREQLLLYTQRDHLTNVAAIISKWAPPSENNTAEYIQGVAHSLGLGPTEPLGSMAPQKLAGLMRAIIMMENGTNPYGLLVDQIAGNLQEDAAV